MWMTVAWKGGLFFWCKEGSECTGMASEVPRTGVETGGNWRTESIVCFSEKKRRWREPKSKRIQESETQRVRETFRFRVNGDGTSRDDGQFHWKAGRRESRHLAEFNCDGNSKIVNSEECSYYLPR